MQHPFKILILTAGYGNGHIQVSETLKQSFYRQGIDNVKIIDLFQEAHPGLNRISRYLYSRSSAFSNYGFNYYGWSYDRTKNMDRRGAWARGFKFLGMRRLVRIIEEEQPQAVLSTFPFGGVSDQLSKMEADIPLFTVVTDFSLHNRWLLTDADQYYVATEELKRDMVDRGVQPGKITVSGIPVRELFYESRAKPSARAASRSILVIAGAHGALPDIKPLVRSLLTIPGVYVDVICGKNDRLRRELQRRYAHEPRIRLFGYVESLHEAMRQAACVVTKAGGITLSELILIGTPILIFKPFPGQERENARYLESKQAALVSASVKEIVAQVQELFDSAALRQTLSTRHEAFAEGRAADTIVRDVLRTIASRKMSSSPSTSHYTGAL
ncbi:MGDG synthase family glycosyltransferase [Cohnella nanjingensis]|uniref:UDP-N-acetylglucosamine 2-epimerase n=1 Tax=Cohnella nanjingensis TaxID=1387779 RepID=A0A7X0RT51_9BACL|nr:glycosyltransferase [Cohnella nanjingensis]MBB6673041.1 UDP-N-acetylglucosamine 2-epimerase [Cohnella nanjingensis]